MRSADRRASRPVLVTAALASVLLAAPLVLAAGPRAEAKQRRRRAPSVSATADQEQLGQPIDDGGDGAVEAAWTVSVEARRHGAAVRSLPAEEGSEVRGRLAPGARLAVLETARAAGCASGPWYRIGAQAWVCADHVSLVHAEPAAEPYPDLGDDELVPFLYAFTGHEATPAYAQPSDVESGPPVSTIGTSWGLAIVEHGTWRTQPLVRTTRGSWIVARELRFVTPSRFGGAPLASPQPAASLAIGWVRRGGAPLYAHPGDARRVGRLRARTLVEVREEVRDGTDGASFTRLRDGRFVASSAIVRPVRLAPPDGVARGERWVDVDLARQTLVAYEGTEPVFATLVSTGRRAGSTPIGLHRVWIKIGHATMDNVEDHGPARIYSMDGVPWIQYFAGDVALHGVYWHDRFGVESSHGCVNLSPRDARWLYGFTLPRVPDGWTRVLPSAAERGTPVHVH